MFSVGSECAQDAGVCVFVLGVCFLVSRIIRSGLERVAYSSGSGSELRLCG